MKILNPLTGNKEPIQVVLHALANQQGCFGSPYDQMAQASEYIEQLEDTLTRLQEFEL